MHHLLCQYNIHEENPIKLGSTLSGCQCRIMKLTWKMLISKSWQCTVQVSYRNLKRFLKTDELYKSSQECSQTSTVIGTKSTHFGKFWSILNFLKHLRWSSFAKKILDVFASVLFSKIFFSFRLQQLLVSRGKLCNWIDYNVIKLH